MAITDNYMGNPQQQLQQLLQQQYPQLAAQYPMFAQQYTQPPQYNQQQYNQQQQGQYPQQGYNNMQQQPQQVQSVQQQQMVNTVLVADESEAQKVFAPMNGNMVVIQCQSGKYLFTKKLADDGTAPLLKYVYDDTPPPPPPKEKEFAEKEEVSDQLSQMSARIEELQNELVTVKNELKSSKEVKEIKGVENNEPITTNGNVKRSTKSQPVSTTTTAE